MKFFITVHPIDFKLLDKLRINHTSKVDVRRVGSVLSRLAKAGYVNVHNYVKDDNYYIHAKKELQK